MRERVFTPEEIAYCASKARPAESFAGGSAAREAVIKALGGYRGRLWQDVGVVRHPERRAVDRPGRQRERTRRRARACPAFLLTVTHKKTNAIAFAVAVTDG